MDNFSLASSSWDEKEYEAIQSVITSGKFSMGEKTQEYESSFSNFVGSKYSVMVNSGSSANLLAVASLFYKKNNPLKKGDEVIVPSVSWSTTYYPLLQYGLKLKFIDIDLHTLNYDLNKLEKAINNKTKLIFIVNLLGNPNDFDAIDKIISNKKLYVIEDNCESLGAKYKNIYAGTFGNLGTFSSYFSHHISTMEGGIVVTNDKELSHIIKSLRAHGWTRDLPKTNYVKSKVDNNFYESFNFVLPGYNLRPLVISAAIGIEQIKKLPNIIKVRRSNAAIFKNLFCKDNRFLFQKEIGESSWFGFSLIINPNFAGHINRDEVIKKLSENDIECRPIVAGNFVKNHVIKYFDYTVDCDLKNANYIHDHGFFVGNHHFDIQDKIIFLKQVLEQL